MQKPKFDSRAYLITKRTPRNIFVVWEETKLDIWYVSGFLEACFLGYL